MLQLSKSLCNVDVLSLRTSGVVAVALKPIINPTNLKIEGWLCQDSFSKNKLILLSQDIRDVIQQGFVVNDHESLSEPGELVRLRDVVRLEFELIGKPVITESKHRIGKISDYAADNTTLYVQKLYVSQPVYKSFSGGQLSVDRTQIIEITNKKIVIKDIEGTIPSPAAATIGV